MKVAVVGAGSTYTPELVSGLSRERLRIEIDELALHDVDAERLSVVGGLAGRMLAAQGFDGALELTDELDSALDGASFVLIQIRVGGQQARLADETVPLACGCIGQETTGAGGLAKAMRTVPVVLSIAERVRERAAPGAWIVDFTNPVGIVMRALLDSGHRAVGLCNVAIGLQRLIGRLVGVESERVVVDQVGLNHLTWVRAVLVDGDDVLPELLEEHGGELAEQREGVPRAATVAEIERELLKLYRDPALAEKPALLERRGGAFYSEAAVGLVDSLVAGAGEVHVVDVHNDGTLEGLAADDVVEVPARVFSGRIEPLPQRSLAPELLGLVQHVAAYERLAAKAGATGDAALARKALLAHPLVGQWELADELVERLLGTEVRA